MSFISETKTKNLQSNGRQFFEYLSIQFKSNLVYLIWIFISEPKLLFFTYRI